MAFEHDDRTPIASSSGLQSSDVAVVDAKANGSTLHKSYMYITVIFKIYSKLNFDTALNEFKCSICELTAPYETFSDEAPKKCSKKIRFREKCYSMLDPFRPPNQRLPLVVGGICSGIYNLLSVSYLNWK